MRIKYKKINIKKFKLIDNETLIFGSIFNPIPSYKLLNACLSYIILHKMTH